MNGGAISVTSCVLGMNVQVDRQGVLHNFLY